MSNQKDLENFKALNGLSEDVLLFNFGLSLESHDFGAGRAARGDIIRRAQVWLSEQKPLLAQRVCSDSRVEALRSKETSDEYDLFVVICDIIGSMHGGIPVATIAMLLLRMGLNALCGKPERCV